jgi:hypothetical protein
MRFFCLYKPADVKSAEAGAPPSPEHVAEMGKFVEEMAKSGALLATDGLYPSVKGARVRLSRGKISVTNGPFSDANGLVTGYAVIRAKSKDEAVELCSRFLKIAGDGESEIRQLYEPSDFENCDGSEK